MGPRPKQIRQMSNKLQAPTPALQYGVPTLPGSAKVNSYEEGAAVAKQIGFPVMLKAAAGSGRGKKIVRYPDEMRPMFASAAAEARTAFKDDTFCVERFIPSTPNIEVQVPGDRFGHIVHPGARDCSRQRHHQKLIEESPASGISEVLCEEIRHTAVTFTRRIRHENAGTMEFIVDQDAGGFYFLELNTRIPLEHPVTQAVTGVDLVLRNSCAWRGASRCGFTKPSCSCAAMRSNVASMPSCRTRDFVPDPGRIVQWSLPEGPNIRVDSHGYAGYNVPMFYDSMLGKLIVYRFNRAEQLNQGGVRSSSSRSRASVRPSISCASSWPIASLPTAKSTPTS